MARRIPQLPSRLLAFTAMAALGMAATRIQAKPNVVLVITDDQGYGDISAHGNNILKTPNMDKVRSQGVRLTDFHVDPTCSPTRSALLTGRYSHRVGVWHTIMGRSLLRGEETTMAEIFAASGYATAAFGKWHLGDNYPMRPEDQGFGESVVFRGGGVTQTPDYWGNDCYDDTYLHNGKFEAYQGYCTDVFFAEAIKFMRKHREKPFFVYLATNAAHSPHIVPKKYSDPYAGKGVNADFYGQIASIDENLGKLMDSLETMGLADSTILIFMTDNGTTVGKQFNAQMRGIKNSEYDGGHRVPFFMRWPGGGLLSGTDVSQLTAHIDILPTLIALCGLKPSTGPAFDGTDLSAILRNASVSLAPRTLVVETQRVDKPVKGRDYAVMQGSWRLVNGKELYDVSTDRNQDNNLAGNAAQADRIKEMKAFYESWWADVSKHDDGYASIVVGSDAENPALLTCHDWHGSDVPHLQSMISSGDVANGFWAIKVAEAGKYEIALRRWPAEAGKPVTDVKARLKVGALDTTKAVSGNPDSVAFEVTLPAGETQLQTWLTNGQNVTRGAYYVVVERLGPSTGLARPAALGNLPGQVRMGPGHNAAGRRVEGDKAAGRYFQVIR